MSPLHILAVDDERDLQFLLEKKYKGPIRAGELCVYYAPGGEAALECLDGHPDIAVVLCDINMPGMDGLTLLGHLVGRHPYVCPIMVTAYGGDMGNIRAAMNGGAVDFLTKPLDFADLEATLGNAARRAMRVRLSDYYIHTLVHEARTAFAVIRDGRMLYANDAWNAALDEAATTLIRSNLGTLAPGDLVQPDTVSSFRWIAAPQTQEFHNHHLRGKTGDLYV